MRFRLKSGASIAYSPAGRGDTTLVMLHPIGLRGAVWGPAAAELAGDCRTLALDLPGHGDSDIPSGRVTIQGISDAVAELIAVIGGERVVLVGCSMGSTIAATVAATQARNVVGLITSNSGHIRSADRHQSLTKRAADASTGITTVLDTTMRRWFTPEFMATRAEIVARATDWLLAGDPVVHGWCWEALRDFDYAPLFPRLTMPALAIGGSLDQSAGAASVEALADAFPDGEYHSVEGAGHLTPLEQPREFAARVRTFLNDRLRAR